MVAFGKVSGIFIVVLIVTTTTLTNGAPKPAAGADGADEAGAPAGAAGKAGAAAPAGKAAAPAGKAAAPAGAVGKAGGAAPAGAPGAAAPAGAAGKAGAATPAGAPGAAAPAGAAGPAGAAAPGGAAIAGAMDVKAAGAKGDGTTDDSAAFEAAWKAACEAGKTMVVPKGDYLVEHVEFKGPCKGPVTLEMNGNLKAPPTVKAGQSHDGWVNFEGIADFLLKGNGAIFDGQGASAWKANDCAKTGECNTLPTNIRFTGLTNSKINGITSLNSKLFHINVLNCKNISLLDIGIDAPKESLNTDGIHIGRSNGVNIIGAKIKTGDDCISIGDGTENLIVENVECGPGHGISVGSLGNYPNEQPVKGIQIRKCTIKDTDNGVRIKTWPGSPPGIASNILFEDITMENVGNPVLIDQEYCPYGKCKAGVPSQVKLSDVTFRGIHGTTSTKEAVKLICSTGAPCTNVALADIELISSGGGGAAGGGGGYSLNSMSDGPGAGAGAGAGAVSACSNVKPLITGKMIPPPCTEIAKPGP